MITKTEEESSRSAQWAGYYEQSGLIFRNGSAVMLPRADEIAASYGFRCAEEMVRALAKHRK